MNIRPDGGRLAASAILKIIRRILRSASMIGPWSMMEIGLLYNDVGSAPPLPSNSGLPELGFLGCRSRIYPTSMGEGWGEGLRSLDGPAPPHPIFYRTMLRIAGSKSTSPHPGEGRSLRAHRFNPKPARTSTSRFPGFFLLSGALLI